MSQIRAVRIGQDEILKAVEDRIAGADEARQDGLAGLAIVTRARGAGLEREIERLEQKYAADHPRVQQVRGLLDADEAALQALRAEVARMSVAPPAADKEAWIIFGAVRQSDGSPLGGVTVMLFDDRNRPVGAVDPATTERDGTYRLDFPMPKPAPGMADGKAPVVHVEVYRGRTRRIAADAMTFQPVPGRVVHRDVSVS
jgi:hypothetical protein